MPAQTPSDAPAAAEEQDFFAKPKSAQDNSLQDGFKAFRERKMIEAKQRKERGLKEKYYHKKRTQEEKDALRAKWIAGLKGYLNVPYSRRYRDECYPDMPADGSGQYLDCCALLRQVTQDLEKEFGWSLGRWNQTYQWALCPEAEIKEEEMKPGDLVRFLGSI